MFPEITRDDVFRLETRRLWLRWPAVSDAADVATLLAAKHERGTTRTAIVPEEGALRAIVGWRIATEQGRAVHLLMASKAPSRGIVGCVHLASDAADRWELSFALLPACRGQGLMTEAARAVVDLAFLLGAVDQVVAFPGSADAEARCVLDRCGFTFLGSGLNRNDGAGRQASDCFGLDRSTWRSVRNWQQPRLGAIAEASCSTCCS